MIRNILISVCFVLALCAIPWIGVSFGMYAVFGILIPYLAGSILLAGIIYRVISWAKAPVPFRIPTTGGQQKSLPWIKANNLENPTNTFGIIGRMLLEILLFRSLFRNSRAGLLDDKRITYTGSRWLWVFGLMFHYSFLIILLRHLHFFLQPIPVIVKLVTSLDGVFDILLPTIYLSDIAFLFCVTFLFLRRVVLPKIRYISLVSDYFALLLLATIAISGILMRNVFKVDLYSVKQLAVGLFSFSPGLYETIGVVFYIHLFCVCILAAYFPFSKLMHMAGIFLSPTRNLANTNRMKRHVNPWDYPVQTHSYEEYEDEFRDKMLSAGIPLDKEGE